MFFIPSVTARVLREEAGENIYGDPTTDATVIQTNVPMHIYEKKRTAPEASTGQLTTVTELRAIADKSINVRRGDRIDTGDAVYLVMQVQDFHNPITDAHRELTLREIE